MELATRPVSNSLIKDGASKTQGELSINLYKNVPFGKLTLEECEDLFRQRIEALHIIETEGSSETRSNVPVMSRLRNIKSYVYKTNCLILNKNDKETQRLDQLSHLLLRLFCVDRSDLWNWFRLNEKRLFLVRLRDQAMSYTSVQLEDILRSFNFDFKRVIGEELSEVIKAKLVSDRIKNDLFKVHFTAALRFIAHRSVPLVNGYALLSRHDIISIVGDAFERHLDEELAFARQHLNLQDPQVTRLMDSMSLVYQDFKDRIDDQKRIERQKSLKDTNRPYAIEIEDLDHLVKNHFPPCMRYLHETLTNDHHLKHSGRLHYGAFLRAGQVDLDTAIEFWRKEFTKKIPNEKFEREYKYNVRHLYGKEGSNKDGLSCFSCDKIINSVPGTSEKHGCPFKHFDDTHLKSMLSRHGLKEVDIESILTKRSQSDPKTACTAYFEYSKGCELPDVIKNPIQFYYESQRMANRPVDDQMNTCEQAATEVPPGNDDPEIEFDD